ncbi:hypothetical protein BE08_01360 [Sorangium cellulosum]|uniref:Integrase n=1 Tax=Sorangium cellulosum TaxID=56 RepID=A0A150PHC5_SORCE|nr:hypothetical protein BE08_01360 [Sorangium cellulosum]
MAEDLKLRRYKPSTCDNYLRCARAFVAYHRKPPQQMGLDEVRAFLLYLAEQRKIAEATQHQYVAALKFLYATTLGRPEVAVAIPWPKVPQKLPPVLSGTEVEALLNAIGSVKHRTIVLTAYGAGLRIDEVCSLRVEDIDSKRKLIHVRNGKHGRDRYVMLSAPVLTALRIHWRAERPAGPELFPGRMQGSVISTLGRAPKRLGADIGVTTVLHTWSRGLSFHPHLHCIVTGGGLSLDGSRWIEGRRGYLFPVQVLGKLFRGELLAALRQAYDAGELDLTGGAAALENPAAFAALLDALYRKTWVVMAACHATTTLEVARTRILAARDAGQRAVGGDAHREGSSREPSPRHIVKVDWCTLLVALTGIDPSICPRCGQAAMARRPLPSCVDASSAAPPDTS